jgi:hypothetical protein
VSDDTVRVRIVAPIPYETEVYRIERWTTGDPYPRDLYDITPEQYQRWTAAWAVWEACEEEMHAVSRDKTRPDLNSSQAAHDWRKRQGRPCCWDKRAQGWTTDCQQGKP